MLVEAPAGCGKTHQGADYARDVAVDRSDRLLILTHTHAACSVFAERTRGSSNRIEIRTIDSLICAYRQPLIISASDFRQMCRTWASGRPMAIGMSRFALQPCSDDIQ